MLDYLFHEISDLSGLEAATNLEVLNLEMQPNLCDIPPLSNLTNLKPLSLMHSQVSDLSDITPLSNLVS